MGGEQAKAAAEAFTLQEQITKAIRVSRSLWPHLASYLHDFHAEGRWKELGVPSFSEWLAQPEVGLSRSVAYGYIEAWRVLAVGGDMSATDLEGLDPSKVATVLPAIKAGMDPAEALADARALSRSDLREQYRAGGREEPLDAEREPQLCPRCGQEMPG